MKSRNRLLLIGLALLVVGGLTMSYPAGPVLAAKAKVIKIGVILPLSGPLTPIGTNCKRGLQLAVERINKAGGIKSLGGAKIVLIFGDDEGKPAVSMAEGERLIKKVKVDVLMGSYTSSCSFPLTQVAERNKIPILVPTSAKDEITERGFKYTFRLVGKASLIAREQLDFVKWLAKTKGAKVKRVALLYEDSGWGQSLAKNLRKLVPKYGYKLVADLSYSKDAKDVRSTILRLKAAKPDVVIQESYTMDAILITKTMHALRFWCMGVVGTGTGHSNIAYHKGTGKLKAYMMQWEGWNAAVPLSEVRELNAIFKKRYNIPLDVYAAFWYTSMYHLAKSLEKAGTLDKAKVRQALATTRLNFREKGNLCLFPIYYNKSGQCAEAAGLYTQWLKGRMEIIYPKQGATAKPVFPVPKWSAR